MWNGGLSSSNFHFSGFLSPFGALNAGILNIQGNIFIPKGYIIDNKKLINESFIKWDCVFTYIPQNQDI